MIFKKNKVIFIHYPKTGGNSIQDALRIYSEDQIIATAAHHDGIQRFEVSNIEDKRLHKHSTLQDYYNSIGDDLFNYKIFINIRNPYDRMVSFYFSPHRGSVRYNRDEFFQFIRQIPPIENYISIKNPFSGKLELFPKINFLKFEKINEDFNVLLQELGVQGIRLPHRNASNREKYSFYYNNEHIKVVSTLHKYEISLGNYRF